MAVREAQPLPEKGDFVGDFGVCEKTQLLDDNELTASPSAGESHRSLAYHLKTILLFTKGDWKTIVIPQTVFALSVAYSAIGSSISSSSSSSDSSSSSSSLLDMTTLATRLPLAVAWLWLHLLVEDITNQRVPGSVLEDAHNKPWRPMPSGRLTFAQAQSLLKLLVPCAVGLSYLLGNLTPSLIMMTLIWYYNDLDGSNAGPWQRNATNAAGIAGFGWGAVAALLGGEAAVPRPDLLRCWLAVTAAIVATTIHAQDFPDVEGDAARGRRTMPLLYGETPSRALLAAAVLFWTAACLLFWDVAALWAWAAALAVASSMAVGTLFDRSQWANELVWKLWCLWIAVIYLLPVVGTAA